MTDTTIRAAHVKPTECPTCPWCRSTDPNRAGIQKETGKVCRDPFHCPLSEGHGPPWRICPYCDWREDPLVEPPAGWVRLGWVDDA